MICSWTDKVVALHGQLFEFHQFSGVLHRFISL
jgi:hypothetical protein